MSEAPASLDALEPFPDSERIQRGAAEMAAAADRAHAIGAPRIELYEPLEPRDHELGKVDPDPGNMSRLKVTREPRELERPASTWEAFESITPQFFLRNTHRAERYADGNLYDYGYVANGRLPLGRVVDILATALVHIESGVSEPLGSAQAHAERVAAQVLMRETRWADHFGRPDPILD